MGIQDKYTDISATNLFNTDDQSLDPNVEMLTTYKDSHKSATQVSVMFGDIWVKEAAGIEIREINTKNPSYHYSNPHHSGMIKGKTHIEGTLYVYETKTQELLATIAKYKLLLERDTYNEKRIEDIVNSRETLLTSNITTTLITQLGATQASELTKKALLLLDGDLLSNEDLLIPKLIIVSGNIDDPNPLIDIYEDVEFNKSTKSVVVDGTTQMRAFTFIGKKRPLRDKPLELIPTDKYILDLRKTIENYLDVFLTQVKRSIGVKIENIDLPLQFTPNNVMYSGTLPSALTSWGTEICLSNIRFIQKGLSQNIPFSYTAYVYRDEYIGASATDEELKLTDKIKRITANREIRASVNGAWNYMYPDADYLEYNTDVIARTLPTNKSFAFSWITPPPGISTADPYRYMEEDRHRVTGSVLSHAFSSMTFVQPKPGITTGKEVMPFRTTRVPVRSLSYVPKSQARKIESAEENVSESDAIALQSYKPFHYVHLNNLFKLNVDLPNLVNAKSQRMGATDKSNDDPIDGIYTYEKWYKYEVGGLFMYNIMRAFYFDEVGAAIDGILSTIGLVDPGSSFWEDSTLGILDNIDKVNFYDDELEDFPPTNSTSYMNVQLYPLGVEGFISNISTIPVLGGLFDAFKSLFSSFAKQVTPWIDHDSIDRDAAKEILAKAKCAKGGIKYIWDLQKIGTGEEKLTTGIAWDREILEGLIGSGKNAIVLVRVISENPAITLQEKDNNNDSRITKEYLLKHTFISASSHVPSGSIELDYSIRTDRAYYKYNTRLAFSWPARILALTDRSYVNNTNRLTSDWAMTLKRSGTLANAIDNVEIIQSRETTDSSIDTSGAWPAIKTSSISVYRYSLGGLQYTLDIANYAYTVFTTLPIISHALSFVNDLTGIDLADIFTDSEINTSKDMWLKYLSAYITGERYTIILDDLVKSLYNEFIHSLLEDDKLMNLLDVDSKSQIVDTSNGNRYKSKNTTQHTSLRTKDIMMNVFTQKLKEHFPRDEYWKVDKLPVKVLSIMGIETSQNVKAVNTNVNEGRRTKSVMVLTKTPPRPSPFLVDFSIQGIDYEAPEYNKKGINIDA